MLDLSPEYLTLIAIFAVLFVGPLAWLFMVDRPAAETRRKSERHPAHNGAEPDSVEATVDGSAAPSGVQAQVAGPSLSTGRP